MVSVNRIGNLRGDRRVPFAPIYGWDVTCLLITLLFDARRWLAMMLAAMLLTWAGWSINQSVDRMQAAEAARASGERFAIMALQNAAAARAE